MKTKISPFSPLQLVTVLAIVFVAGFILALFLFYPLIDSNSQEQQEERYEGIVQPEFRSIVYEVNNANWVTVTLYFSHSDDYINAQAFVSGTQDKGYITDFSPVYCENSTCWSIFEIGLGESDSYHVDIELVDSDGNQDWFSTNLYYGPWGVSLP